MGPLSNFFDIGRPHNWDPLLQRGIGLIGGTFQDRLIIGSGESTKIIAHPSDSSGEDSFRHFPSYMRVVSPFRAHSPLMHPCGEPGGKPRHFLLLDGLTGSYACPVHEALQPDFGYLKFAEPSSYLLSSSFQAGGQVANFEVGRIRQISLRSL